MKSFVLIATALFFTCATGAGEDRDQIKALLPDALRGLPQAQYELGVIYYQAENYLQATGWLLRAARQGHADAQSQLAVCYTFGHGVPQDRDKAIDWLTKAANQGNANARFNLGICYEDGINVKQNHRQAIAWFTKVSNYVEAQYHLGLCHAALGENQLAAGWFAKAAAQGHASAMEHLQPPAAKPAPPPTVISAQSTAPTEKTPAIQPPADALPPTVIPAQPTPPAAKQPEPIKDPGETAPPITAPMTKEEPEKNPDEPAKPIPTAKPTPPQPVPDDLALLTKAANKGDIPAQIRLASRYANGLGVRKNYDNAELWLTKAASQGSADAQYELGMLYRQHYAFVSKRVAQLFTAAAGQNHAGAQYMLGWCYANDYGVPDRDWKKAAEWYAKAAGQGNADAQYALGKCYQEGLGVPRDAKQAAAWLAKAAAQNHPKAGAELKKSAKR
ncbi:MAG: hypothetical protein LBD30_07305 [Verrucomicrobiales bacterium]|jgi:TPR repeat protein|nr:hypothetical protein [Verrucomicrobiales bacterium]